MSKSGVKRCRCFTVPEAPPDYTGDVELVEVNGNIDTAVILLHAVSMLLRTVLSLRAVLSSLAV